MALLVSVRNINPMGDVTVHDPVTGDRIHVLAGATVSVSPELAGQGPQWRRVEVDADGHPTERIDLVETRQHAGHLELLDLGTGLLSQAGNWEPVTDDGSGDEREQGAEA